MKRFDFSSTKLRAATALGVVLALAVATTGFAKPGGGGCKGEKRGDRIERKIAALEVDEEKRAAAYAVVDKARSARRGLEAELRTARERMRSMLDGEAPSEEEVLAQAERIGALETELHRDRLKTMLAVRSIVGAEAWKKVEKRRDRAGRRGMHRDGARARF